MLGGVLSDEHKKPETEARGALAGAEALAVGLSEILCSEPVH